MTGRIALVTGAGRGLGRAIAEALAAEGVAVAVTDIDLGAATAVAEALPGRGAPAARAWRLDVCDAALVREVFEEAEHALGRPEILVNNAGIYPDHALVDMPETAWDAVIDTNLKGPFLCSQAFTRRRIEAGGGGAIVNLASTAAFSARAGAGHYSASKAGLVMLTKCMALEFGPHRIRVNAVAPGLIEVEGERVSADYKRSFLPMIPYGRIGQPADVARAVVFLALDSADFITGTVLPIDGGFLTGRPLVRAGSI
jgi:3-oxoacyl-[acyl-carrier protein] reductase